MKIFCVILDHPYELILLIVYTIQFKDGLKLLDFGGVQSQQTIYGRTLQDEFFHQIVKRLEFIS